MFTIPIDSHVKQVLVTGPKSARDYDLAKIWRGKEEVYVNPVCLLPKPAAFESIIPKDRKRHPAEIADPDLTDEDLL